MLINLSDDNDDSDSKNLRNTEPSGKMQVLPNPSSSSKPPVKDKRRLISSSQVTVVLVSVFAITLITTIYLANYKGNSDISKNKNNDLNVDISETETGGTDNYLSDSKVCGRWTVVDYVENISDFDVNNLSYKKYGTRLYAYITEFFEDNSAIVKYSGIEEKYAWINKDKFNILPDNADIIAVHKIKKIKKTDYMFIENKQLNAITDVEIPGYYVLRRDKDKVLSNYDDIRNKDLRNYNLSNIGNMIKTLAFNEKTKFPTDRNKMPQLDKNQPGDIMESGKNPGLGVRVLHEQGITGKGVNIAIIAEPLILDHPEYKGKIIEYKDFGSQADSSIEGPAVASLLAGETTGTAPGVKIYYAAVPVWDFYDAAYYANALDWIVEINKTLPPGEKIKAVCISPNPENPSPWINVDKYLKSFQRAEKEGLLVLDCSNEHGVVIGVCGYDFENPEDVTLCKSRNMYRILIASYHYDTVKDILIDGEESYENMIRAPGYYRTMAQSYNNGEFSYQYDGRGQLSWAIPYVTGVLAMGWQVKPELTADEIIKIMFDTAYVDKTNNKYIYPTAFIEYLKNH